MNLFLCILVISVQLTVNNWLLNLYLLVSVATTLPNVPQPAVVVA